MVRQPIPGNYTIKAITAAYFLFRLAVIQSSPLGFHRDELLYLALGRRPDFGYWSNPPLIGALSWFSQHVFGDTLFATRLLPALAGTALCWFTLRTVQLLGGSAKALWLAGAAMIASVAWQRAFLMFQPVPFDILVWGILSFLLVRHLKQPEKVDGWRIGAVAGLGMLLKYTIVFWAAALFLALLAVPQRRLLVAPEPWKALLAALLVFSPNLYWQYSKGWPVFAHMTELAQSQLTNVRPLHFLTDQLLMHGAALFVWLPGLVFLWVHPRMQPFRLAGWFFLALLAVFLSTNGKSYYMLGAYPVLFAAGGVCFEQYFKKWWTAASAGIAVCLLSLPLLPAGVPYLPALQLSEYFRHPALEGALRWEDGRLHALPQDYADMLGWQEIADLTDNALQQHGRTNDILVYAENYGQAGAIELLSETGLSVVSFSDSYRLWAPPTLPPGVQNLVYVNDALGNDVRQLFADILLIGSVQDTFAREHGTSVYLCTQPRSDFGAFWEERAIQVNSR